MIIDDDGRRFKFRRCRRTALTLDVRGVYHRAVAVVGCSPKRPRCARPSLVRPHVADRLARHPVLVRQHARCFSQ